MQCRFRGLPFDFRAERAILGWTASGMETQTMPRYMLLLHDDPAPFRAMSPEEIQRAIGKYVAWGDRLRAGGVLAASHKLADEPGRVVRRRGSSVVVTDGPYSETKEILGGYYLVTADSYDRAVDLTRDCPHLEYGGTIEVREVDEMMG